MPAEVAAERDVVDVDEQAFLAEALHQPVENAPGHGGIGAPVGDDDLRSLRARAHSSVPWRRQRLDYFGSRIETLNDPS